MPHTIFSILASAACGVLLLLGTGCGKASTEDGGGPSIFVSIAPQREAVERIAGAGWRVHVLVPPGASPESFSPDARTLEALSRAQMLFTIGVPMEAALLPKVSAIAPDLAIIDGTAGMEKHSFSEEEGEGADPHVWLLVSNMERFAAQVAGELSRRDPEHAVAYNEACAAYCGELQALDKALSGQLAPLKDRDFVAYHPAFGYITRRYGLCQHAVEREGKEPAGGYLNDLIREARAAGIPALFIQPQFNRRPAKALAREVGDCEVVTLDPLPEHYLQGMAEIGTAIAKAYGVQEEN